MKIAIMQPYFFPYLGYFQLIHAVDKFIIYDDINFIKQGWINRNYILANGIKHLVSVPVKQISSNNQINKTFVSPFPIQWDLKLINLIFHAYKKAPFFEDVFPLVKSIVINKEEMNIGTLATKSIVVVMKYLELNTILIESSSIYQNDNLKKEERVIDICLKEKATQYINAIGGLDLYDRENFSAKGLALNFIKPSKVMYNQFQTEFISNLSIIDVMMFNSVDQIEKMLNNYELA